MGKTEPTSPGDINIRGGDARDGERGGDVRIDASSGDIIFKAGDYVASTPPEQWSQHYSPKELTKLFGFGWDKLKGMLDRNEIKHVKHTTKDYQIALSDMPNPD